MWVLGILLGAGALFYMMQHNGPQEMMEKRRRLKMPEMYYQSYKDNLSNPLFVRNQFQEQADVSRTGDTSTGLPQFLVSHSGNRFNLSRMPRVL